MSVNEVMEDATNASASEGVKSLKMENGNAVFELGSGEFHFKVSKTSRCLYVDLFSEISLITMICLNECILALKGRYITAMGGANYSNHHRLEKIVTLLEIGELSRAIKVQVSDTTMINRITNACPKIVFKKNTIIGNE